MSQLRCRLTGEEAERIKQANERDIVLERRPRFESGSPPRYVVNEYHSEFYKEMNLIISERGGIPKAGLELPLDGDGWEFFMDVEDVLQFEI